MDLSEISIIYHIGLVLFVLWMAGSAGLSHSMLFFLAFVYLFMVHERYSMRFRKRVQYEEKKSAYQRRLLTDGESVRWLNHALEKMWPICMERIVSELLHPIIPWFLDKFKPWTVSKASVQEFYMGRNPPLFTSMRVITESSDDDHLILEIGMNFLSGEDMSAVLAMQLHKSVGFGMTANMHLTSMHVEGKILVGVKFVRHWPFLGRVRLCFVEPPYFQMQVKPLASHGIDVTELPGVSGWIDKLLDTAFGQTLVEPNMLVLDMEKFTTAPEEKDWFSIKERPPIAYVKLELLEGADMKPSDPNGLADPYVKGRLGHCMFQTKIQYKTLYPKWCEEFKVPITSWEADNELVFEVRDKDPMFDDHLGDCTVNINELRHGQRHDKWISLKNVKKGRIHLAITIEDVPQPQVVEKEVTGKELISQKTDSIVPVENSISGSQGADQLSGEKQPLMDELEPINIEGTPQAGVYVHRPGSGVPQTWEPRKGRARLTETKVHQEVDKSKDITVPKIILPGSNTNGNGKKDESRTPRTGNGQGGMFSMFHKNSKKESSREPDPKLPSTPSASTSPHPANQTGEAAQRLDSKKKTGEKSVEIIEGKGSDVLSDELKDAPIVAEGHPIAHST